MTLDRSKQKKLTGSDEAVPTTFGWVNPLTGELLVSIRGLPGAFHWDAKTNTFTKGGKVVNFGKKVPEKAKAEAKEVVEEKATEKVEETKEVVEEKTEERAAPAKKQPRKAAAKKKAKED